MSKALSWIIVTHRRAAVLDHCLASVRAQRGVDSEIIVVANGMDPETRTVLDRHSDAVRVTVLDRNCGVTVARNVGLAIASRDLLFFLDDDAEVRDPECARLTVEHFERHADTGVLGMLVVRSSDGLPERACIPFRGKRVPRETAEACTYPGGACAIRRSVFDRVGPYDESFFYSGEEMDLAYAALDLGFRIRFDPALVVTHHGAEQSGKDLAQYFYPRNRPWVALRHLPLGYVMTHCAAWWGWGLLRGLRTGQLRTALRAIYDCVRAMPRVMRTRRRLTRATLRMLVEYEGRIWY